MIHALPGLCHVAFLVFPMVSSLAFQAFNCEAFDDGARYLRADYSLDCDSAEYYPVRALAVLAIALYPVGIPLGSLLLLLRVRTAILAEEPSTLSCACRPQLASLRRCHTSKSTSWPA